MTDGPGNSSMLYCLIQKQVYKIQYDSRICIDKFLKIESLLFICTSNPGNLGCSYDLLWPVSEFQSLSVGGFATSTLNLLEVNTIN